MGPMLDNSSHDNLSNHPILLIIGQVPLSEVAHQSTQAFQPECLLDLPFISRGEKHWFLIGRARSTKRGLESYLF